MINRNYFYIILGIAAACLALIMVSVGEEEKEVIIKREMVVPNPKSPFKSYISGVGIVEPKGDNIYISSTLNRVVEKVAVKVGGNVKKNDELITLENRDLKANYHVQEEALKNALLRLKKLKEYPREEDLQQVKAALDIAKADFDQAKRQYDMVLALPDPRAISLDEQYRRYSNYELAQAKKLQAQAEYDKIKAGSWKPDVQIAYSDVLQAQANLQSIKTEIDRTIIRAPIDGTVLQIKVHEGESTSADQGPLMILGDVAELNLRVNINQFDIPFFHSEAMAVAYSEGDARIEYPLEFLYVEPYLTTKQNLNNKIYEKVDTRVLQIVYRIKKLDPKLYVGQQMETYIETKSFP